MAETDWEQWTLSLTMDLRQAGPLSESYLSQIWASARKSELGWSMIFENDHLKVISNLGGPSKFGYQFILYRRVE